MNPTKQENSTPSPATTAYPQSPTTHIPIDPALQTATTTAASPYQHYQVRPVQVAPAQSAQVSGSGNGAVDSSDIASLNDALGSADVDLRAGEESLPRSQYSYRSAYNEDRTRKQASFDTHFLGTTMRTISTEHKITTIPEDSVNYMALVLRARLQDLITAMIAAAHHRTDTQFDRPASLYEDGQPMWSILLRSDELEAIEKIEREEEIRIRRERKERADMTAAQAATETSFEDGSEGGSKKKRKKDDGPARNMSEDVRKKIPNAVAGIGGKSAATAESSTDGWARPYVSAKKTPAPVDQEDTRLPVKLIDTLFAIDEERGHGGGRGAARGWT